MLCDEEKQDSLGSLISHSAGLADLSGVPAHWGLGHLWGCFT